MFQVVLLTESLDSGDNQATTGPNSFYDYAISA